jgi:two-component system, cell cycle response regulator
LERCGSPVENRALRTQKTDYSSANLPGSKGKIARLSIVEHGAVCCYSSPILDTGRLTMEASVLSAALPRARPLNEIKDGRRLAVRGLLVLTALGLVSYAAHSLLGLGGQTLNDFFETWVFNGLLLASAACCLLRAGWSRVERTAWAALGLGLGCWALGEIFYTLDPSQVSSGAFPTLDDFLWLAYYPAAFLTLGLLVRARVRQFYPSLWLDGALGALALAAVASQFLLPPIVAETGGSVSQVIGDLVYPLGDLLLLAFAVGVLAITGWRPGRVLATVAAGIGLGAIADCLSLYAAAHGSNGAHWFDSLWPASAVMLAWGAWHPSRPSAVIGLHGRRLLVFPVAFALTALGLLVLRQTGPLHGASYILAVVVIAGVIVRMVFTFCENLELVRRSRHEALTDPLTGLGNRRRLLLALEDALQSSSARAPWVLLLFDLNGFKVYNDSYGHPAGDALLVRLGEQLARTVAPAGTAYRLGGDEFCVLARVDAPGRETFVNRAVAALSEQGEGFDVSTACGCIALPEEAHDVSSALRLADERLYVDKRSRPAYDASEQLRSVLLQVVAEHEPELPEHLRQVALMARAVGRRLGIAEEELETLVRAAELHDIGKIAVPETILQKPSRLDRSERAIIERHCEVGERILAAADAMLPVARVVRASHEHFDGRGYPDGRRGLEIPLEARIIAVCDAFHAMTADRPYRAAIPPAEAIAELRRAAGTQFDPQVVDAFCADFHTWQLPSDKGGWRAHELRVGAGA